MVTELNSNMQGNVLYLKHSKIAYGQAKQKRSNFSFEDAQNRQTDEGDRLP